MGSNLAKDDEFLRVIKIRRMTSFGGKLKPAALCCNMLWHVEHPYSLKKDICRQNAGIFLAKFLLICY
jgi:hypothetical protein